MKIPKFSVLLAMACSPIGLMFAVSSAQAIDFNFSANFSNGYSAQGSFTTKSNAPASFSEISPGFAPFVTQFLQSQSLSIFDSNNTLLQSGSQVINGISTDKFFRLDYNNTLTPNLTALNISTETPSQNPYYFIANNVDPSGTPVAVGSTAYNLFLYNRTTDNYNFLGSTSSIQATTSVPEPFTIVGTIIGGTAAFRMRKKLKAIAN